MKEIPFYFYGEKKVVLLYPEDAAGFTSLSNDGNYNPYELTEELYSYLREHDISPCLTGDDAYSSYAGPEEIVHTTVQNFENEQGLLCDWVRKSYAEQDEAHRELVVVTDRYYAWTSERKRFIDLHAGNSSFSEEDLRKEWNEICSRYAQPFDGDDISFESVLKEI